MMTEEEVPDEFEHVEQSLIQASDGDIEPVEHLPELMEECSFEDFMKLGSRSDKKVHEDKVVEPKCGMIFDTADEAYTFYNGYARKIGFSVRKLRTNKKKDDGTIGWYIVKELVGWKRIRKFAYNRLEHSVSCTCQKLEFHGILCSHALKVFRDLQYESLPRRYYLKRWTRTSVDEDVFDLGGRNGDGVAAGVLVESPGRSSSSRIMCFGRVLWSIFFISFLDDLSSIRFKFLLSARCRSLRGSLSRST
ncbi:hypothetical protein Vadar_028458 [Vaccinium darrowii]|uniref:Uncharacterized protein n=1 Tax=Vaccinium darrowii TaxID=229202 RepID=A0ACB7Z7P8_9ERIC|nr:hypothetical protein Vadar_028458 [Vaccinium darrowii]